jgi:hypothetical protein
MTGLSFRIDLQFLERGSPLTASRPGALRRIRVRLAMAPLEFVIAVHFAGDDVPCDYPSSRR